MVKEVPAIPVVKREVTAKETATPEFQSSVQAYAESSNTLSAIGALAAQTASNQLATQLGAEEGKTPHGNLYPSLTEFDKNFAASYKTQAQATLGLQANRLITESNIEIARQPRITPGLIESTNRKVSMGLKNIFANAPTEIQANLEYHYGNVQLNQQADLSQRMFREQRQDRQNNSALASQMNAEHAYAFALHGNDNAALNAIESTKKLNDADVGARVTDPLKAKSYVDSVRKSYATGKLIHDYEQHKAEGKGEEFLKSIAEKKPEYLSDNDYLAVSGNLINYVGHQQSLISQDEQLRMARFNTVVAGDPVAAGALLQDLLDNVSPSNYQKAEAHYINAIKQWTKQNHDENAATGSWSDPYVLSRLGDKTVNKTFDKLVAREVAQTGKSRDEAETTVALSAGAAVPVFVDTTNKKLTSGNPAYIASAAAQVQRLRDLEGEHALAGLSKQAQAMSIMFQHQRGSMPDADLARKLHDNLSHIDDTMQKTLDNSWNIKLTSKGAGGLGARKSLASFALSETKINSSNLGGKYFETIYGNDIYQQLKSNYDATRGDYDAALQMTKDYVKQNYGETGVNGGNHITDRPLEKILGYKNNDVVPYIQQDILSQLEKSFSEHSGENNETWSIIPVSTKKGMSISGNWPVAEVMRTVKTDKGEKKYRYPVNVIGRPNDEWDIVLETPTQRQNIFLIAPNLQILTYKPDAESIKRNYDSVKNNPSDVQKHFLGGLNAKAD
jgi:hypothetical protein